MFDYDWFHGPAFQQQRSEAKRRCTLKRFPDADPEKLEASEELKEFHSKLEDRTLIYLRDGFSYEVKGIADVDTKAHLVFECEPVDDQYKVGAFIVTVPFDEIVRVEVFAVHPTEKPEDMPQITGFRAPAEPHEFRHKDVQPPKKPKPGR
ncbi:MAG: hypothetical protein IH989_00850 [Planctomycetes bacterium]|nr:hypothetical protein [Planctomycetota bacterium]